MDPFRELLKEYEKIWALNYSSALLGWDTHTYMPDGSAEERGDALGVLSIMKRKIFTSKRFQRLVSTAEKVADDDIKRGIVRVLKKDLHFYNNIPEDLLREMERLGSEAKVAWLKARKQADFSIFSPYLQRIVDLSKEIAQRLGYEEHPYDALLDLYEEGLRTRDVEKLFSELEKPLKKELDRILSFWPQKHPLEEVKYRKEDMESLNKEVLTLLGFDWNYQRLDESPHPFTENIGLYDVRITTRYHQKDFRASLLAVVHEFGHALYERQCDPSLWKTPVCGGVSLGIHESQSRFWENVLARSLPFAELIQPLISKYLSIDVEPAELFHYFTLVRPSPIRVEADEVTYNFHILLRFRIEKGLMDGSIAVGEVPEVWNNLMEEYLGVEVRNDAEGCLQDVHWSMGSIGYFPTYTIGTIVAAQIGERMKKELNVEELISRGDFEPIRNYLREKIHKYGSIYPPKELLHRALGEGLNPRTFIRYIRSKYS